MQDRLTTRTVEPAQAQSRGYVSGCFVLMMVAIQLVLGPKIRLSQWGMSADSNAAVREAVAWMSGRLDLPHANTDLAHERMHDTAYFEGKVYNVFPPMMTMLTVLVAPFNRLLALPDGFWHPLPYTLFVFWPLPIVGFVVFRRAVGDAAWAALLTLAWMGGTAVLPNLRGAQTGYLGETDHVISQVGLLIFAADVLGRQRIWPALLGLLISTWTRQMTLLYGLPRLWVAWRRGGGRLAMCAAGLVLIAAPLLVLNGLKFGNPLDFGYRHIYVGREDGLMGQRCLEIGTFSPRFLLENAYYMHLAPPAVDVSLTQLRIREANEFGTSLWITSPLLLLVVLSVRLWWRDGNRRILMLSTLPVMLGILCYHSPGFMEHGYSRFALDFVPIWLLVIAPMTRGPWRREAAGSVVSDPGLVQPGPALQGAATTGAALSGPAFDGKTSQGRPLQGRTWFALACVAWSLLYFQAIVPNTPALPARPAAANVVSDAPV